MFNGDKENYDHWEIQWKAFAKVENLVSDREKELDSDTPASVVAYNKTERLEQLKRSRKLWFR